MSSDDSKKICDLCDSEPSKYVCPRCGVSYCSLVCYKDQKHLQCSESFYRDCVMNDLKGLQAEDPESGKKMKETLQRFHEQYDQQDAFDENAGEEELDSDDDEPLEKRLLGINLDNADEVWNTLTDEEKIEFEKFAKSVKAEQVVPEWTPWWLEMPIVPKLVQEVDENLKEEAVTTLEKSPKKFLKNQPDILNNISPMSSLTKVKPNDHVKRGLANVIASYVWTCRLYNGEFLTYENPQEIAASLITLSSFLSKDTVFGTFEHALADVSLNACQIPELFDGGPVLQSTLSQDVFKIVMGPGDNYDKNSYVLSALTACYKLLVRVAKNNATTSKSTFDTIYAPSNSIIIDSKLLTKCKRKLNYLLAFANEFDF